jgi:hypothetical protein
MIRKEYYVVGFHYVFFFIAPSHFLLGPNLNTTLLLTHSLCSSLKVRDQNKHRISICYLYTWGHAVAQWLRHCATNRKVAGSIPDGVIGIFHWRNPSGRTMTLGLTQPQKWVSGIFPRGKGGRCVGLTTLPPSCADCLKIWVPQPPGTLMACKGL